ncbi:MAG: hypothetical protein JWQ74_342 [Marmoricola sp.]|nr:hypothetical protein [Marmoricola sp.]
MKSIRASILAVLGSFALVLAPQSAHAGNGGGTYYYSSGCSGFAARAVYSPGSSFLATDGCGDGHSAVTQWKAGSSATINSLWARSGAGGTVSKDNSYGSSTAIHLRACIGEYGPRTILKCSNWVSV